MNIEEVLTNKLIPYANNARTHSDEQVTQIASSIREFGFNNPVLIDEQSTIIAGHGRVLAALKLDLEKVPCIRLIHLTEIQRKAYIIADNKLALNANWDDEILKLELEMLREANCDIDILGFDDKELQSLFDNTEDIDDDFKEPVDKNRNLLMIECEGEHDLEKLFSEMQERGFQCKILN